MSLKMILVIIGIPLGLFCIILGGKGVIQELNLKNHAQTIQATITDTRDGDQGYEVKYQFDVNNASYSFSDGSGRKNLWVTLPSPEYNLLKVMYLPNNPWVNRPVNRKTNSMESSLTAFGFGIIALAFGTFLAILDIRRYLSAKKAVTP